MKFITNILNKLKLKNTDIQLGRWNIEKCNKKMNNKIDLSNEDHCGPCGQYALNKIKLKIKKDVNEDVNENIKANNPKSS